MLQAWKAFLPDRISRGTVACEAVGEHKCDGHVRYYGPGTMVCKCPCHAALICNCEVHRKAALSAERVRERFGKGRKSQAVDESGATPA